MRCVLILGNVNCRLQQRGLLGQFGEHLLLRLDRDFTRLDLGQLFRRQLIEGLGQVSTGLLCRIREIKFGLRLNLILLGRTCGNSLCVLICLVSLRLGILFGLLRSVGLGFLLCGQFLIGRRCNSLASNNLVKQLRG